jgi:signal transduction histidine kinase
MDAQSSATLHFPDAPKLELDALIDQLVDRARDVQRSQGRLRALLRAIETITEDPSLDAVLRSVVEAACTLTDAADGALDVAGAGDGSDHPADPTGDSVLAVPVHVNGEVFGTLHLTGRTAGHFSAEDRALVAALALAAGTAIGNARLLEESRLQQRWLTASVQISAQLLADVGDDPLNMITALCIEIAGADVVAVGLLTPDSSAFMVEAASGVASTDLVGRRFEVATSRIRSTLQDGVPLLLTADDAARNPVPDGVPLDAGPLMALPLVGAQVVRGVLTLMRRRGRLPFTGAELAMAAGFAGHASVALELADARTARQRLVRSEDRERIARNLHDHVIQELFAIGLGLEATVPFVEPDGVAAGRLAQRVRDIDRTIRQIRTSIFELRGPMDSTVEGTRYRVLEIATDLVEGLGFTPRVVFDGLVDVGLSPGLIADVLAVVREGLTNVAKHAGAARADVDVSVTAAGLTLVVSDDGIGFTPPERSSGLANLRARAEGRGGSFDISTPAGGGTCLSWKAPL